MSDISQTGAAAPEPPQDPQLVPGSVESGFRSEAQILLDRYHRQFSRMMQLHRRLVEVRGTIVATPAPSSGAEPPAEPQPKSTAFFAGLTMLANADDAVIKALESDVEDIAKLFGCEAAKPQ
jgi:hypothetical protein